MKPWLSWERIPDLLIERPTGVKLPMETRVVDIVATST